MDVDGVGAGAGAVMGAAVARSVQKGEGYAGELGHSCADCGSVVTGKYCSECGQPAHVHRSLLHLGHEILHGVMHFDGRIWRTLPLLFLNPGKLTREWCQGKRARYVSPLAIFLFTLFVIFFSLTFVHAPTVQVNNARNAASELVEIETLRAKLTETKTEIQSIDEAFATSTAADRIALGTRKGVLAGLMASLEAQIASIEAGEKTASASTSTERTDGLVPGSWQAQVADLNWQSDDKGFMSKIGQKLKNPDYTLARKVLKDLCLAVAANRWNEQDHVQEVPQSEDLGGCDRSRPVADRRRFCYRPATAHGSCAVGQAPTGYAGP